jgi:hypothetical protein
MTLEEFEQHQDYVTKIVKRYINLEAVLYKLGTYDYDYIKTEPIDSIEDNTIQVNLDLSVVETAVKWEMHEIEDTLKKWGISVNCGDVINK